MYFLPSEPQEMEYEIKAEYGIILQRIFFLDPCCEWL